MTRILASVLLVLLASPTFAADVFVKIKTHSDPIAAGGQAQPARDAVAEQWYGPGKTAQSGGDGGFIVDLEKNMAYMVNHRDKSYVPMPLPIDITKVLPPEVAQMAPRMQMTATVTPTSETRTIGSWPCTGYDVSLTVMGMPMAMRVWASTAVPAALLDSASKVTPVFLQGQMPLTDESVKVFAKIRGFQVATELTADVMGARMRTTTEVVEIVETPAPAGTFAPPAGYAQKATLSLQDLQRR
jgi:opacity protein-like surface antigen